MNTVESYILREQQRAYERLSHFLGYGRDAAKAHATIAHPPTPGVVASMPEELKAQFAAAEGTTAEQFRAFDAQTAEVHRRYFSRELPTPYEDARWYPMLAMLFDEMRVDFPLDPMPLFATIPLGEVNATARLEPRTNTPVIFFEHGMFRFLYDFAMLAGWAMPPLSVQQLTSERALAAVAPIEPDAVAVAAFGEVLHDYVIFGNPQHRSQGVPRPPHNQLPAGLLASFAERFVVAHELSHVQLGHLGQPPSWEQELDADFRALAIVSRQSHATGGTKAFAIWAIDVALTAMDYLELTLGLMKFGDVPNWVSASHPPPAERRKRLRMEVDGLQNELPETVTAVRHLATMSGTIFDRMWEDALGRLEIAYRKGDRPFQGWDNHINKSFAERNRTDGAGN